MLSRTQKLPNILSNLWPVKMANLTRSEVIQNGLYRAPTGCSAAVAGLIAPAAAVRRIATTVRRAAAAATWAFAFPGHSSFWFFTLLPFEKKAEAFTGCVRSEAAKHPVNSRSVGVLCGTGVKADFRHSGEGRNPEALIDSGCRIKSGMTVSLVLTFQSGNKGGKK